MPQRAHLRRLDQVWIKDPIYFITICCAARRQVLTGHVPATILVEAWRESSGLYGWAIGRYVIMPDHVHFFARVQANAKPLSIFVGNWKRWTASQIVKQIAITPPLWQPEFFDHLLRSESSYAEKWSYVQTNPVRAGLVAAAADWPHAGEITPLIF